MNTERYILSATAKKRRRIIRNVEFVLCGIIGAGIYALTVLALYLTGVL